MAGTGRDQVLRPSRMHQHRGMDKLLFPSGTGCFRMEYLELAGNKPAKLLEFLLFACQPGFVRLGYIELGCQNPGRCMVFLHPVKGTENRIF